jgi:squalene monooxygenase
VVNNKFDIIIVGGGIAGATIAARLAKSGKKIVVIERNLSERNVIIGELLQPGGVQKLQEMGFESFLENIDAQPVFGYDIIFEKKDCPILYPTNNGEPCGYGFRNGAFLQNIRKHISEQSNITVIEGNVLNLIEKDNAVVGVNYMSKNAKEEDRLFAGLTIVNDGPMSKFRERLSKSKKSVSGFFLGLLLKNCELPFPNSGHLVIGDHPPFVIYPVTSSAWRILIDFKGKESPKINSDFSKYLLDTFENYIPTSAKEAFVTAVNEGDFKIFPNHRLPAKPIKKAGVVLFGDALNMRHPLTGGGMTAVFSDVVTLGNNLESVKDFSNRKMLGKAIQNFYETRYLTTQNTNILADGLYGVVYNPDLRRAFFEYVSRGGKYAEETIAILAGLNKDKALLLKHFIGMAHFGVKVRAKSNDEGDDISGTINMVKDAISIITPLLISEKAIGVKDLLKLAMNK